MSEIEKKAIKVALRMRGLAGRDALSPQYRAAASEKLATYVGDLPIPEGAIVSGFWPIRSEVDPRGVMQALEKRSHRLALPVILEDRITMLFRSWTFGQALVPAGFGLSVPPPSEPVVVPDAMLVPLAAFDRRGYRIGYGKGHYDRAIARIERDTSLLKIGIAFAAQEIEHVPDEPHDRPLDFVLTEDGVIACGDAADSGAGAGAAR